MKIRSIKKTTKRLPVYDLEVPKYHNFILANSGIVVHNSIDAVRYGLEKYANKRGN